MCTTWFQLKTDDNDVIVIAMHTWRAGDEFQS